METIQSMPTRIRVASIIRKAILSGELPAGEELSLTGIAEKIGVSRTPVREAFQTLESEGLIELRMNRGAVVRPIDDTFIQDHFEMRAFLEGEAVYRAIKRNMSPVPLEKLQNVIIDNALDSEAYNRYNTSFHTCIWEAAGSQKLYGFCETLWNGPSYSRTIDDGEHRKRSIEEHNQIVLCIGGGKADYGRKAMSEHIIRSMQNILSAYKMDSTKSK